MAGKKKKVLERRSGLRPSEKELPERCSSAFHHKNTPGFTVIKHFFYNEADSWIYKHNNCFSELK
jgi:hypothetical protein